MSKTNAVGWFDIYVNDLDRAVSFYQTVLGCKLEPIGDPTGESRMMSFPADMSVYGAGGALTKSAHAAPGVGGTTVYFSAEDCAVEEARALMRPGAKWSGRNSQSVNSAGFRCARTPRATCLA